MKPETSIKELLDLYNPNATLEQAWTIPSPWYVDPRIAELEQRTVFSRTWQVAGRASQVSEPGQYITTEIAGEPVVVVRGSDNVLRAFYNVCRHHAAAVMTEPEGTAQSLRCPYHGWTYSLAGELKGTPDFAGVGDFDRLAHGLLSVKTSIWEKWVFVRLDRGPVAPTDQEPQSAKTPFDPDSLASFLSEGLIAQTRPLALDKLHWLERRHYTFTCNWKVFVDNYLDGGYHVPHLHKGLDSVLDYSNYTIENGERFCLQSSPIVSAGAEAETGAVRKGERALYYWIYPNFMINWYDGAMDTNLVIPLGVDRTEVIFDFYFPDISAAAYEHNRASIEVGQRIQDEDVAICHSVQRGLQSRAYHAGRLSVRREAGEHLFHRLLYADLKAGVS